MQTESYLEEAVTMTDEARKGGKTKYTMATIVSYSSIVVGIISLFFAFISNFQLWIMLIPAVLFIASFVFFRIRRDKYLFECDYILVEDSLRIAKVLNGRNRKALAVIECKNVIQAGKIDSDGYKRYSTMKEIKPLMATPNVGYSDDNIFYLYIEQNGSKKLVLIEPSNLMMLSIAKAAKKNIFS